jgi:maltooligosyltrehalose trehalohydrolase
MANSRCPTRHRGLRTAGWHGWSVVVDPRDYHWRHPHWKGRPWHEAVIYELHVGAMGGYANVARHLPRLG